MRVSLISATALAMASASTLSAQTNSASGHAGGMVAFGSSVVVTESAVFVGRPGDLALFPAPAGETGGVHVFTGNAADGWSEVGSVSTSDGSVGDGFGRAFAVSGNVMAVGAAGTSGGGAVYVFNGSGASWNQVAVIRGQEQDGAQFGAAVAVAGNYIFVGAPAADEARGMVYVFHGTGGNYQMIARLTNPQGQAGDGFGSALHSNGRRLAVGAPGALPVGGFLGGGQAPRPGKVVVYSVDGEDVAEAGSIAAEEGDLSLGASVRFEGGNLYVGAPTTAQGGGVVRIYDGALNATSTISGPDGPQSLFGSSIAFASGDMLVGAMLSQQLAGKVHVFRNQGGSWTHADEMTASSLGFGGMFGAALSARGNIAVIGAPGADFFTGNGYVYVRAADGDWSQADMIVEAYGGPMAVSGEQVTCTDGMASGFTCDDMDLVSFMRVGDIGGDRGIMLNDVWGWTDSTTQRDYAIVGRFDATAFIDVTDPENPVYLGELPLTEGATPNLWRDIKVYSNHAYIVADNAGQHGVQIFDLTDLRGVREPQVFEEAGHYTEIASAHNIVINEQSGFAYVVGASGGGTTCGGGLHMMDLSDPANPTFAGCFGHEGTGNAGTGYSHDAQCVMYNGPDAEHRGREICFGSNETALSIADVTDKENPMALAAAPYPSVAYAHQGWISDDHRYFYLNDELDELSGQVEGTRTLVWDIEDLDDPVLVTEHIAENGATDHNLYIKGNLMYQANYVSGLRVFDISDPTNPVEVGYFDTVPWGEDAPGFAGAFSNYPYFDSGVVVVTSMREGVFILKKKENLVP